MVEETLVRLCGEVIGRSDVTAEANFLSLGGDSIKAIALSRRIFEELGRTVAFIDILRQPTIRAWGDALAGGSDADAEGPIEPVSLRANYPVSHAQRSFYMLARMIRVDEYAGATHVMHFDDERPAADYESAFRHVLDRHEILRSVFEVDDGKVVQRVLDGEEVLSGFEYTDLEMERHPVERLRRIHEASLTRHIELSTGPVARLHICRLGTGRLVGLLSVHHIAMDGFSAGVIERDFRGFLHRAEDTSPSPGSALRFQYKDYVHWLDRWLTTEAGRRSLEFWRSSLADYRPKRFLSAASHGPSFVAARHEVPLDVAVAEKLRRVSAETETTLFVVLQSAIKVFVWRETGSEDIVTGSPITTRDTAELADQVGPYLNTLPIRSAVRKIDRFVDLVAAVNDATLAAYAHKRVPVEVIAADADLDGQLFDVGFTLQNQREESVSMASPLFAVLQPPEHYSESLTVSLWIVAEERAGTLRLGLHYRPHQLTADRASALGRRLAGVITALAHAPTETLGASFASDTHVVTEAIPLDFGG